MIDQDGTDQSGVVFFLPLMSFIVQAPSNMLHDEGAY